MGVSTRNAIYADRFSLPTRGPALVAVAIALCLLLGGAHAAWGQRQSGRVVIKKGLIKLGRFGRETVHEQIGVAIPVFEGDIVQTGPKSRATVFIRGDDTVQMYSNSFLKIEAVQPRKISLGLSIGKALFGFLQREKAARRLTVRSQTIVIGVKGTKFALGSDEEKSYVLTVEGVVTAKNLEKPDAEEVTLTPDQVYFVAKGKPVEPPVTIAPEIREAILTEDGLGTFQELERQADERRRERDRVKRRNTRAYIHGGPIAFSVDYKAGTAEFTETIDAGSGFLGLEAFLAPYLSLDFEMFVGTPEEISIDEIPDSGVDITGDYTAAVASLMGVLPVGPVRLRAGIGVYTTRVDYEPSNAVGSAQSRSLRQTGALVKVGLDVTIMRAYLGVSAFAGSGNAEGSAVDEKKDFGFDVADSRVSGASVLLGINF